jgi:hypothetical protein
MLRFGPSDKDLDLMKEDGDRVRDFAWLCVADLEKYLEMES